MFFRLQRFEKTNEMLTNCNQLSVTRLKTAGADFKKHTALLIEMKKDLDYIFKKIKLLKTKLSQQYPQAYNGNNKYISKLCYLILFHSLIHQLYIMFKFCRGSEKQFSRRSC